MSVEYMECFLLFLFCIQMKLKYDEFVDINRKKIKERGSLQSQFVIYISEWEKLFQETQMGCNSQLGDWQHQN